MKTMSFSYQKPHKMPSFAKATEDDAQVVELVDTQDLKSCDHCDRSGSTPLPGTEVRMSAKSESEPYEFWPFFILILLLTLFKFTLQ